MSELDPPPATTLTIAAQLRRSYAKFPDNVAVIDGEQTLTYSDLWSRSRRIIAAMRNLGIVPGDRVAIIGANSASWIEIDHACFVGGIVRLAPITRLHPNEIGSILQDADPVAVFVDADWLADAGPDCIPTSVSHTIIMDGPAPAGTISLTDIVDRVSEADLAQEVPVIDPQAPALLMYTSGSTGLPKGVGTSQYGVGASLRNCFAELPGLNAEDILLHTGPLSHFCSALALPSFTVGATNVIHKGFDLDAVIDALNSGTVTVLPLVPTQIGMLTDEILRRRADGQAIDISRLREIPYAGSAIPPDRLALAISVFGKIMRQMYGSTESPVPVTTLAPEDHIDTTAAPGRLPRLASAGRPNSYIELRIVDNQNQPVAAGVTGEIEVRGDNTMSGYWRQPDATAEVLDADGWLRMGDLGYLDEDGFLFIVDRKKDMIISGGFNVYPREVENVISTLPAVSEVAVVGAPSERWGEEIVAVVSLRPGVELSADEVIAHCRDFIAGYKVPKRVVFADSLPKSAVGKINKRAIQDELWAGSERRV